jgi:branched-chain amino acid transport system permease protein
MELILQLAVAGLMIGTLYGLIGFTQTLMFRSTGVLSFAHAAFALVGGYTYTGLVCRHRTATLSATACDPFLAPWQAACIAVLASITMALLVERLVIRPLQHADPVIKSIATAAVLALASGVVLQVFGLQARNLPPNGALVPAGGITVFGVAVEWARLLMFGVSILLVAGLALLLRRSWLGLGVRAAGQLAVPVLFRMRRTI